MKFNSYYKIRAEYKFILLFLLFTSLFFSFCKEEPQLWRLKSEEQVIGDYIDNNPEKYSEFTKLIESTGLSALMKIRGPYTLMLPTNDAMFEYYQKKNVSSFMDFADTTLRYDLAYNHIIQTEINTSDIGLGALREPNALGDYLVTEFRGSDIIINKSSRIIKRDIICANGIIHVIDKVLEPTYNDVYSVVSSNPSFKIFAEGLKLTRLKDTLEIISFPFGDRTARTRFTLLAVPDTIYQRYGINNVTDLIDWCGANADSLTYLTNPFYRYMEYHCMMGSYFLSTFKSGIYPILSSDNNISIKIGTDYKINENSVTKKYTGFIIPESNYPAKNGAMHTINDLLPVIDPEPAVILFETTDYFDLKQGDYYHNYYMKWSGSEGLTKFKNIKWEGDYLQYYYNEMATDNLNFDCLNMNGFWWVEITTPKIMKGKYEITANIWGGGQYLTYVDGVKYPIINTSVRGVQDILGTYTWTKTEEHKIKLVAIIWSVVFWDTVVFTPQ